MPNIELHPDVPDVVPFYKRCGIVVVPILAGGGTRIKILEAGMAGRPVMATPMGANGLDVIDGKDLFLFTDKRTFMDSYDKLKDKEVYDSIVCNMKFLVKDRYSPDSFNSRMTEAIRPFL
jgi:glycosyltransferase involved in cell wall biosynthesis